MEYEEKTVQLAETTSSSMQGASFTAYGLNPVEFTKEIVEAAKVQNFFLNFVKVMYAPAGTKDVVIPKHTRYLGDSGVTYTTTEATNTDLSATTLNSYSSVTATPALQQARFAITDWAARINLVNLLEAARDELSYSIGEKVDKYIATVIGDATTATTTVVGCALIYGGDAYSDATLAAGDTITTELVAKAARMLKDKRVYGWHSNTLTLGTAVKNAWSNSSDDPFVLFIAPSQEEVFRKDSQFVNASEYGSNSVVMNGEIGEYLGIKIVVTPNLESVNAGSAGPDGTTVPAGVVMTRCLLCKPKKACALVWGMEPTIEAGRDVSKAQTILLLQAAYQARVVQDDAIVLIDVAD
jgi:N4-gp56 family major capsid protein